MADTSRGWVMDLVNSIANDLALVNHLMETLHAKHVDSESAEGKDKQTVDDQIIAIEKMIETTLELRRDKMKRMTEEFDDYDPRMWCAIKHSIESYMESMEVYQATKSMEDWDLFSRTFDNMASVISVALGYEMESCARCFADALRDEK